jgi:sRNA-binding carbon storage regulator CsrA
VTGPLQVPIHRGEVYQRIHGEHAEPHNSRDASSTSLHDNTLHSALNSAPACS